MLPGLSKLLDRLKQTRDRDVADLRRGCPGPACPEAMLGLSLEPGARVVDLVSGQEGEILAGTKSANLVSASSEAIRRRVSREAG